MMQVARIRRPEAFLLPGFQELILDSMKSNDLVTDPEAAVIELAGCVHRDDIGLFIVGEKDNWKGVLLAQWSKSALCPGCTVIHISNRGNRHVRDLLVRAAVDYAREGGYDTLIGMFSEDHKKGLSRVFNTLGEPRHVGQMVVFDLNECLI